MKENMNVSSDSRSLFRERAGERDFFYLSPSPKSSPTGEEFCACMFLPDFVKPKPWKEPKCLK